MTGGVPSGKRRALAVAAVALAAVAGVALVVLLLWAASRPDPPDTDDRPITPAPDTTATAPPAPGGSGDTDEGPGQPDPASPPDAADPAVVPGGRSPRIAFRLGDTVYISAEDGSATRRILTSREGPYALAPDGSKVAVVDSGALKLVDTETGVVEEVGQAEAGMPVWMPDSSAVLFVRSEPSQTLHIWRVNRDGSAPKMLTPGMAVSVSPDGETIVVRKDLPGGVGQVPSRGVVYVSRAGAVFRPVTVGGYPTAVAATDDRMYVGVYDSAGKAAILSVGFDGRGEQRLTGPPATEAYCAWAELWVSPDGARILAVAAGDDGYSRLTVIPLNGGDETRLSRRREMYMRGWSADGSEIFAVEGNYFQGEPTMLLRLSIDGARRTPVTSGAE